MKNVFTLVAIAVITLIASTTIKAQNVGISSAPITPDPQAILELRSTAKGVLLPRMTTGQATTLAASLNAADDGMTVYDTDLKVYKVWNGSTLTWSTLATTGGISGNTLDQAYDQGGAGVGRVITANNGAVQITGTGGATGLITDGDIQLTTDDAWIGAGATLERIEFDQNLNRINLEAADITLTNQKWMGIDGSNPRITFDGTANKLNLQDANIEIDAEKWLGVGSSIERIEFQGTDNEINIMGATGGVGIGTMAPSTELDVNGQIRMRSGSTAGYVPVGDVNGVMTWTDPNSLGVSGNTLDEAYDQGGPGAGRTITTDAGSVHFVGLGGLNVDWKIGIGTTTPNDHFHIVGASGGQIIDSYGNLSGNIPSIFLRRGRGSSTTPLAVQTNDLLGQLRFGGHDGTTIWGYAQIQARATENWTSSAQGTAYDFRTVANGTTLGLSAVTIDHNGFVGMGTTLPSTELDVNGQIRMRTGATAGYVPVADVFGVMTWTDPSTISGDINSVTAGSGLIGGGTTGDVTLDVVASNGLTTNADDIKLGGALTQATTITHGNNQMRFNMDGTGDFAVQDNGVNKLFVSAATGFVGINTSAPSYNLEIRGDAKVTGVEYFGLNGSEFDGNSQGGTIELGPTNSAASETPTLDFHFGAGAAQDYNYRMINAANNRLDFVSSTGANITMKDGRVGIGTNNPADDLHILHDVNAGVGITIENNNTGTGATSALIFDYAGSEYAGIYSRSANHPSVPDYLQIINNHGVGSTIQMVNNGSAVMEIDDAGSVKLNSYTSGFSGLIYANSAGTLLKNDLSGNASDVLTGVGTWTSVSSLVSGNTLDGAYDQGGAGAGRVITADNGAVEIQGADGLLVSGNISIGNSIYHNGDANTFVSFTPDRIQMFAGSSTSSWIDIQNSASELAINENNLNRDFRVEGGTDANLLFVDGGNNNVGIGNNSPDFKLDVSGYAAANNMVTIIPLWQAGSNYFMNNTGGADLANCESGINPDIYNANGNLEVKLVIRVTSTSGGTIGNFQLRTHDGTTESFPIVNTDPWTWAATQSGYVVTSPWKTWNAGTNAHELHLHGWVNGGTSLNFNSAYLMIRSQQN